MYAYANGSEVWVVAPGDALVDPNASLRILTEFAEAKREYDAHVEDLFGVALRPYEERLNAANEDVRDLLTERFSIEAAERLVGRISRAILAARVTRGDYDYEDAE